MIENDGLKEKVVLMTGGSRGIGAEVARRFAASGCKVVIGYRADAVSANKLAAEIKAAGGTCIISQADIANAEDIKAFVATAVRNFEHVDILVNCAAVGTYCPLGKMDASFVQTILNTNVLGIVLMTQEVLPHMGTGGRIINFSSALAYRPIPTSSVYSASKAAVITLTHAFAKELGPRGITVNSVAPGVIETDMTTAIIAERGEQITAMTPLGRIGQTQDIAGIVTFLATPEAGWITGRTIIADGGIT